MDGGWQVLGVQGRAGLDPLTRLVLDDSRAPVRYVPVDGPKALAGFLQDAVRDSPKPAPSVQAVLADLDRFAFASTPPTVTWREGGSITAAATTAGGLGHFFAPRAATVLPGLQPGPGAARALLDMVAEPMLQWLSAAMAKKLVASLRRRWERPLVLTSIGTLQAQPTPATTLPLDPDAFDLTLITGWSQKDARKALRHLPLPVTSVVTEGAAFVTPVLGGILGTARPLYTPAEMEAAKRAFYGFLEATALSENTAARQRFVLRSQPNEAGVGVYVDLDRDEAASMEGELASQERRLKDVASLHAALRGGGAVGKVAGTAVAVTDDPETAYRVEKTMADRHTYWPYVLWRQDGLLHVSVETPQPAPPAPGAAARRADGLVAACRKAEASGAARDEHLVVQKDGCVDVFVRPKHHYRQDIVEQAAVDGVRKVVYVSRGTSSDAPLIADLARTYGHRFDAFAVRDLPPVLQGLGIHPARVDDDVRSVLGTVGGPFSLLWRGLGRRSGR